MSEGLPGGGMLRVRYGHSRQTGRAEGGCVVHWAESSVVWALVIPAHLASIPLPRFLFGASCSSILSLFSFLWGLTLPYPGT